MLNRIFRSIVQPYFVRKKTHSTREVLIQLLALKHIIHRNLMLAIQIIKNPILLFSTIWYFVII